MLSQVSLSVVHMAWFRFILYTADWFTILENKMLRHADDSTLLRMIESPCSRNAGKAIRLGDLSETKTMDFSRYCTIASLPSS